MGCLDGTANGQGASSRAWGSRGGKVTSGRVDRARDYGELKFGSVARVRGWGWDRDQAPHL